jgi:hypothetical protein
LLIGEENQLLLLVNGAGLSGNGASMSFSEPVRWVDDPTLCCVGEAVVVIAAEEDGFLDRDMKERAWVGVVKCVCVWGGGGKTGSCTLDGEEKRREEKRTARFWNWILMLPTL